jgi:hypothetical protein
VATKNDKRTVLVVSKTVFQTILKSLEAVLRMSEGNTLFLYKTTQLLQLTSKHTRRPMSTHRTPFVMYISFEMYKLYSAGSKSDSENENESVALYDDEG